jgi:hypothetical protein
MSASGWEENTTDIGLFINQAEQIKRAFGCTVVTLHHTPVDDDTRARGGGALNAAIGAEFRLRGDISRQTLDAGRAVIYAVCIKMQGGEKDETPVHRLRSGTPGIPRHSIELKGEISGLPGSRSAPIGTPAARQLFP